MLMEYMPPLHSIRSKLTDYRDEDIGYNNECVIVLTILFVF